MWVFVYKFEESSADLKKKSKSQNKKVHKLQKNKIEFESYQQYQLSIKRCTNAIKIHNYLKPNSKDVVCIFFSVRDLHYLWCNLSY